MVYLGFGADSFGSDLAQSRRQSGQIFLSRLTAHVCPSHQLGTTPSQNKLLVASAPSIDTCIAMRARGDSICPIVTRLIISANRPPTRLARPNRMPAHVCWPQLLLYDQHVLVDARSVVPLRTREARDQNLKMGRKWRRLKSKSECKFRIFHLPISNVWNT